MAHHLNPLSSQPIPYLSRPPVIRQPHIRLNTLQLYWPITQLMPLNVQIAKVPMSNENEN